MEKLAGTKKSESSVQQHMGNGNRDENSKASTRSPMWGDIVLALNVRPLVEDLGPLDWALAP